MKRKILRILLIIILIFTILFLLNFIRKVYIVSTFNKESLEYRNIKNFYTKMHDGEVIVEMWRKDDLGIYKRTSEEGTRIICFGEENNWLINDVINSEKVAVKIPKENGPIMPHLAGSSIYTEKFSESAALALMCQITTEEIDEVKCYKIKLSDDVMIYVNAENFLRMREINGSTDTGNIEYKINGVTDKDVATPNLYGFTIIDGN